MQEESMEDTLAHQEQMNLVFANHSEEDAIYPLSVQNCPNTEKLDARLKMINNQYATQWVENTEVLCKDGKMVIPEALQHHAVSWYHHYLQHPGHTRLEETLRAARYWKGMQNTVVNKSKTVMHAKSTRGISISMGNSLQNSPSQTLSLIHI